MSSFFVGGTHRVYNALLTTGAVGGALLYLFFRSFGVIVVYNKVLGTSSILSLGLFNTYSVVAYTFGSCCIVFCQSVSISCEKHG